MHGNTGGEKKKQCSSSSRQCLRTLARLWTVCCTTGPREEGHPEADMPKPLSDHRAPIEIKDPVSERIDRTIESHIREVVPAEVISAREAVDKARLAEIIESSIG